MLITESNNENQIKILSVSILESVSGDNQIERLAFFI